MEVREVILGRAIHVQKNGNVCVHAEVAPRAKHRPLPQGASLQEFLDINDFIVGGSSAEFFNKPVNLAEVFRPLALGELESIIDKII